jgi:hypothetical protein
VNDRSWRDADHVLAFLVPAFLHYLDVRADVDAASQDQAAESMVFLLEHLLQTDLRTPARHPDRRSVAAADAPGSQTAERGSQGNEQNSFLPPRPLFHTSSPINEALELCAGDVDLDAGLIYVSDPMGTPKQITELPEALRAPLRRYPKRLREEHGPQYFDAPLFQARALQGETSGERAEDASDQQPASPSAEETSSDCPASPWGYAEASQCRPPCGWSSGNWGRPVRAEGSGDEERRGTGLSRTS